MRHVKTLGLIALIASAVSAFPGSAGATNLTSPAGTVYTGEVKAESEGSITIKSSFIGTISCASSSSAGRVEVHGTGVTTVEHIDSVTTGICTGGTPTKIEKKGTTEIHSSSSWFHSATVTWNGSETIIHGTLAGTCTFTSSNTDSGTLTGSSQTGGAATFDMSAVLIRTGGNGFCGESATWTGSYKITTPSTLDVD